MKKKNRKKNTAGNKHKLFTSAILHALQSALAPLNARQVASSLGIIDKNGRNKVYDTLLALEEAGEIMQSEPGVFSVVQTQNLIVGKVDILQSGNAYVISDSSENDIFISSANVNGAFHGDTVEVSLFGRRKVRKPEGEIVRIITRARSEFPGTFRISGRSYLVEPDSNRIPYDIIVPENATKSAQNGMKVIVKITAWPDGRKQSVTGEVVRILGLPGANETEINAIMAEFGLPWEFPQIVEEASNKISFELTADEIRKRKDFRGIPTFTIDPADAKDFDDALSIRMLEDGRFEIGVHIADVSHYIAENDVLDREAVKRATSVYLVDRVVPMLPERLSNGVCSLRPDEDKFCFSAVFIVDADAVVHDQWFGRTVIRSTRRFSYEEAQQVIESGTGDFTAEILILHKLAQRMRKERFQSGALRVEQHEVKFKLDENGVPVEVYFKYNRESNQLIEEFMLLANKKVAEFIGKKKNKTDVTKPFVYRIHDQPDPVKLKEFAEFAANFGYKLKLDNPARISKSLNALLDEVKGKPEENMIEQLAIRSMAKAIYSTQNIGHYGLAFTYYTHFTSPIRRYPDVMVHRLLQHYLDGGSPAGAEHLEKLCKHSSEREKLAAEAERASIKYKQAEYMSSRVGRVFAGLITGVTEWGVYVEMLDNKCEGMVRLKDMRDDIYYLDEKNHSVVGKNKKRRYRLGDTVYVLVNKVDMQKRQTELLFENI
jgi:ribonuclease R